MKNIYYLIVISCTLFYSSLNAQWVQTNFPYSGTVNCLADGPNGVGGKNLFAGTEGGGVYLSTDDGTSWQAANNGLGGSVAVRSIVISGLNVLAMTEGGIYYSTNSGSSWQAAAPISTELKCIAIKDSNFFAGTYDPNGGGEVYRSTNNGTSWTEVNNGSAGGSVYAFAVSGSNIFAATQVFDLTGGIYLSTNSGTSWIPKNQGISVAPTTRALLIANNYIFAGIDENSVWRRAYSDIIGIQNISTEVPSSFSLKQNYPNPFNPATNLEFEIADPGYVSLKIYDLLGKEVVTLVNEKLNPGTYRFEFEADNLTSGVYFYRLSSGDFTDTKRMMLVK